MKNSRFGILTIVVLIGAGLLVGTIGQARKSLSQDSEKSLDIERYANEPLSLVDLKVSDESVKSKIGTKQRSGDEGLDNVKFRDQADWFKRVSIRLQNTSGKPITGIQAYLYFKVAGAPALFRVGLDASTSLKQGVVEPGEEVELKVSEQHWNYTAEILKKHGADANLATITLSVERVSFTKDLQWSRGQLIGRDAHNPNKWNVIDKKE